MSVEAVTALIMIGWAVIGVACFIAYWVQVSDTFTGADLLVALLAGSLVGPLGLLSLVVLWIEGSGFPQRELWRRPTPGVTDVKWRDRTRKRIGKD